MNTNTFFIISRSFLLRMGNVSDKSCRENQNTCFVLGDFCIKFCRLWKNVEKYCRAGNTTYDNMAHAHCMPDTYGYKYTHTHTHTLRLCNTHCFYTATLVAWTRLNVTLYVHCLSCVFCLYHTACCVISLRVTIVTNSRHSVNSWPPRFFSNAVNRILSILRCVIPVVLSQILQCIICMYLHIHAVRNTTINRWYHYVSVNCCVSDCMYM